MDHEENDSRGDSKIREITILNLVSGSLESKK